MNIYVASYFNTRERLRPYVKTLSDRGHVITSTWLDEELKPGKKAEETETHLYTPIELRQFAHRDYQDLMRTDVLILDTIDVTPRGGREVEWGAYVFGKIPFGVIVGPKRNVFHEFALSQFKDWEELLKSPYFVRQPAFQAS